MLWIRILAMAWVATLLPVWLAGSTWAAEPANSLTAVVLPPLRYDGKPARAHTQGLEIVRGDYYVTARREDVQPRRAWLLRTRPGRTDWDIWDITPASVETMDHPGGMQSDDERLWIPVAESKRSGRSVIRSVRMVDLEAGRSAAIEREFAVNDHIGAIAVSRERKELLGASWDTATVYLWSFSGELLRTFSGLELDARRLGIRPGSAAGLAVQDWKVVGDQLFASGLLRDPTPDRARSEVSIFDRIAGADFRRVSLALPRAGTELLGAVELGREGMAIHDEQIFWLPEDLGETNQIFRLPLRPGVR